MGLSSLNGGFPIYTGSITMNILDLTGTITYKERTFHCQVWFRRVLIWSSQCQIRLAAVIFGFIQQSLPPEKSNPFFWCFLGDSHQMKTSTTSECFTVDSPVGLFFATLSNECDMVDSTCLSWWSEWKIKTYPADSYGCYSYNVAPNAKLAFFNPIIQFAKCITLTDI
jgi:hypothetical protein